MKTETWRGVPSLEFHYEVCLETSEVRHTKRKKVLTPNPSGVVYGCWGLGKEGEKHRWGRSVKSLLSECFPFWWIRELNDGEECKSVDGFPGYYITTWGRVYSDRTNGFLKLQPEPPYYYCYNLYKGETRHKTYGHTLVGRNFLPDWEPGLSVLHRDETLPFPEINHPENLWVGTCGENNTDRHQKGRTRGWGRPKQN
jgi:hypothetical protein